MEIRSKEVILSTDDDYEFVNLIAYIRKVGYGEFKLKVKDGKPYQVVETLKSILLTKKAGDKDNE